MPLGVQAHEGGQLQEAGIDPSSRADLALGHQADHLLAEPFDGLGGREFVDLGGGDARVDRPGHERHAGGLGGILARRHDRHRRQRRDRGLAHRDDMRIRPQKLQERDDIGGEVVEGEGARRQRHIACVLPVGDINLEIPQQGLDGAAQQRGEMARHGRHQQHFGQMLPILA